MNKYIALSLCFGVSTAYAGFLGNTPKPFSSDNLEITLTPNPPMIADGGPSWKETIDGNEISIINDSVTDKLDELATVLSKYSESKECTFEPVSLGKFSTSGTLKKASYTSWTRNKVKYISADIKNADEIAKKLKLPTNWKRFCK